MKYVLLIVIVFCSLAHVLAQVDEFEDDSLFVIPKGAGEFYLTLGYRDAIKRTSAYKSSAFQVGAGVEMLPGNWAIGASANFAYRHRTYKIFENLGVPHLMIYGMYKLFDVEKRQYYHGLTVEYLTGVHSEDNTQTYSSKFNQQSYFCVGTKGVYKFPFPIGNKKFAKVVLSLFYQLSLPVYAFLKDNNLDPLSSRNYSQWTYRFGLQGGARIGFGN